MPNKLQKVRFAIVNDERHTLATCVMLSQQGQNKQLKLLTYPNTDLTALEHINLFSLNSTEFMAWRGKITRQRDEQVIFFAEEQIDENFRRHLRINMDFDTYIYSLNNDKIRYKVKSNDISCGGVSIFSNVKLSAGQRFEVVIPCTEPPIIVPIEVLRMLPDGQNLYACQFINLLPQEEALIQESIFEYDLRTNSKR